MKIRKAGIHDVRGIYSLILSATRRGKILKRSPRDVQKAIRHFWVIEDEGKIIGCCAIEVYNKKLAEIRSLAVAPEQVRKGLATRLIQHCLQEARKKRIYEVLAITDKQNLFKRMGFSEQLHGQKPLFLRP